MADGKVGGSSLFYGSVYVETKANWRIELRKWASNYEFEGRGALIL